MRPLKYFMEAREIRRRKILTGRILRETNGDYFAAACEVENKEETFSQLRALYRERIA